MRNPLLPKKVKKLEVKTKYKYPEAYRFILYQNRNKKEIIWNGRDGAVPVIIYSKDGTEQLTRDKFWKEIRVRNYIPKDNELYFANTTKARAKFLAKKIVYGRWHNSRYPLCQEYGNKKEAIFLIYKNLYEDGNQFTILKQGRNKTTYMHKHFRGF